MPSLYEGFGFPVLEAQACGTPVICANAASLPEVAGDAALLFECGPRGAEALSAAILRILSDHELCRSLRTTGLAHAAAFGWEHTARRTLDLYRDDMDSLRASKNPMKITVD